MEKLLHKDKHDFFVETAYKVYQALGYNDVSKEDIEETINNDGYRLDVLAPKGHLYMGMWATGKWEFVVKDDNSQETISTKETYGCDYPEEYPDYSISIFIIHKWLLDKYRPSSANYMFQVTPDTTEEELNKAISLLRLYHNNKTYAYNDLSYRYRRIMRLN